VQGVYYTDVVLVPSGTSTFGPLAPGLFYSVYCYLPGNSSFADRVAGITVEQAP